MRKKQILAMLCALTLTIGNIGIVAQAEEPESVVGEACTTIEEGVSEDQSVTITGGTDTTIKPLQLPGFNSRDSVSTYSTIYDSAQMQALLYTNKERISRGLIPLSITPDLLNAANVRANEIITYFDHTRPDGREWSTVLDEYGIGWGVAGENIAAGPVGPQEVVSQLWMNSPGHRQNILTPEYQHLGMGYAYAPNGYGNHWVQLFTGGCSDITITDVYKETGTSSEFNSYHIGTSIEDMKLFLAVECAAHGEALIPVTSEMCTGLNIWTAGYQEMTIHYGNATVTVEIIMHPFDDVSDGWYTDSAMFVYISGIMTGLNDHTFGVETKLSRAQFASMLHRMEGEPSVAYRPIFPDVERGMWYTTPILWANSEGIVNGYGSGKFGPADNITREQMAIMMHNYAVYCGFDVSESANLGGYPDAYKVSDYAMEAMSWAVGTGIITGKQGGTYLDPQGQATRAECATILTRFMMTYA